MRSQHDPAHDEQQRPGVQRPTIAATRPRRKQGGKQKLANGLVTLSSAAVLAVYAAGYLRTAPAAASVTAPVAIVSTVTTPVTTVASLDPATVTPVATATTVTAPTAPAPVTPPIATATTATTATAQPAPVVNASSAYRDGTYSGSGTSRHGGVTVAVVIENGTIASVAITSSTTRYPIARIASLPGEVVAAQSANIDFVSGATDSSTAFQIAVASALAQAKGV